MKNKRQGQCGIMGVVVLIVKQPRLHLTAHCVVSSVRVTNIKPCTTENQAETFEVKDSC